MTKRASGLVRGLVLQALREAMAARGPLCFESRRAAAREFAALLDVAEATIRRAFAHPDNTDLAAAIQAAIKPRSPFTGAADQGAAPAEIGSDPVGDPGSDPVGDPEGSSGDPVVIQRDPAKPAGSPSSESPQVSPGDPSNRPPAPSRARDTHCSTKGPETSAVSSPLADPDPIPTSLGRRPAYIGRSQFAGECYLCCCYLEEGQALILVPYHKRRGARIFCMDHAELGLDLAQAEWDAAHPAPADGTTTSTTTRRSDHR